MKGKGKRKYTTVGNTLFMLQNVARRVPVVILLTVLQAVFAVAVSVLELYVAPYILKSLEVHSALSELFRTILFFTIGITTASALAAYVDKNLLFGRVQLRLEIMNMVRDKAVTCSYPLREKKEFSSLLAKATEVLSDNGRASEAIWNTLAELLQNVTGFVIYFVLLQNMDAVVLGVMVLTTALGYLMNYRINRWDYRHRREGEELAAKIFYIQDRALDRYLAKDIRIFGMQKWLRALYGKYMRLYQAFYGKREMRYFAADLTDLALTVLRNAVAYGYLLYMALGGRIGAAEFLLYFTAVGGFTKWLTGIMENVTMLYRQGMELDFVREALDYQELFLMEGGEPVEADENGGYTIVLRDVSFRMFSHLNLTIHAGEKLAVVGLNGAGKTTLVKLICGFYDPDEGEVLLNGKNIKTFNRREYYKLIAGVFQDFSVIPASIAANVAQDAEDYDMDRVSACIDKAGLKKKIETLPQQYDTLLGRDVHEDAVELSGGELQRLMLARLLYKESPIMVLDEPTAALDPIAENDIYERYHELTRGKSAIFVSHRLASTRFCDRILLVENGKITEEGTHDALLKKGRRYAELFALQSKYYRTEVPKSERSFGI